MENRTDMFNETWTWDEHRLFEKVFSQFSEAPDLIERVCVAVGNKTYEEVKKHCEELVEDLRFLEESEIKIEYKKDANGENRAGESSENRASENSENQKRQRRQ